MANQNFKVKKGLEVGTGVTISDGNINISGIITAQFSGDGSALTGVTAAGSGVVVQEEGSNIGTAATINFIGSSVTAALSGGIANVTVTGGGDVVSDTTPQLGGNLDLNSKDITGTGNISITGGFNATGVSTFQENVNFTSTASFGDNDKINVGTGNDLQIFHDGTSNIISDAVGAGISLVGNTKVVGVLTATGGLRVPGGTGVSNRVEFGNNQEFTLQYNTATTRGILTAAANGIDIQATTIKLLPNVGANGVIVNQNGSVELYHAGSKRFETTGVGVTVFGTTQTQQLNVAGVSTFTGTTEVKNASFKVTNDSASGHYLQITQNDNASVNIDKVGNGAFFIKGNNIYLQKVGTNETYAGFEADSRSFLNYDAVTKFETTSTGVVITGVATATSFSGSGSALTGLTGASAGTYGASTNTPIITVDSNGRITGIATVATSGAGGGGGISNIVEDTTPQLGGNLDLNSKSITGTGNIDITGYAGVSGVSTFSGSVGFATHIHDAGTGGLDIRTNLLRIKNDADSETLATFAEDGAVSFYHDNTLKFNTTSTGVNITGKLNVSGTGLIDDSVGIGTDPDAGYHSATNGLVVKRGGTNEGITIDCSNQAGIFFSNGSNGAVDINGQLIYYHTSGDESMRFLAQGEKLRIEEGGAVLPGADNAQNFGSTSKRWANIYSSGIVTATSFFGDGSGLTNLPATGISTASSNVQVNFDVTANGSGAYRFTGPGNDAADDNPDLYLIRGQRYRFTNNSGGSHPFQIRSSPGGSAYSTGITNNGGASGNIDFNVQHDAPERLYYQCTSHSAMVGNIYIVGGSDWRMTSVNTSTAPEIYTTRNVGIGTDNPSVLLDVNGDVSFNGTINGLNISIPGTTASSKNTSLGEYALNSIGSGYRNTAVGHQALQNVITGIDNTAVGSQVLRDSTAGSNTGVGSYSLLANTTGHSNTCIGNNSGKQVVDGIRNICLGYSAGQSITSGSGNTIIGCNINGSSTLTDTVIIGAGNGVERLRISSNGYVGIGLTNPAAKLHVSGSAWNNATGGDVVISNSGTVGSSLNLRPTNSGSYSAGWSLYAGASTSNIGDGNIGFWNHTTSTAPFKITQSGDVGIADGNLVVASGHGIDFSATSGTGTSELLDDYEEGTWTPTMSGATLKNQHLTSGVYPSRYTKIGRQVTLDLAVSWSVISANTELKIGGLPFTASNGLWGGGLWYNGWSVQPVDLMFWVGGDTTYLKFYTATNGSVSALTQSDMSTGGNIYGSITYFV